MAVQHRGRGLVVLLLRPIGRQGGLVAAQQHTVLVVEDEDDLASLVEVNLQLADYRVRLAADGEQALRSIDEEVPDLVLLDVMMPGIDGWTVLREIKEDEATRDLPIIMLTALTEERDLIRGHLQGAVEYVTKPFEMRRLLDAVEEALRPPTDEQRAARRRRTMTMLQRLAEMETGRTAESQVRLSNLERTPTPDTPDEDEVTTEQRAGLETLTEKQRWLASALGAGWPARRIAEHLEVSRSNVYATRRRVARRLGVEPDDVAATAAALGIADEAGPPPAQ